MTIYHMPESKSEQALMINLSGVPNLSGVNIVTKFSSTVNDDENKSTVAILANQCEPDDNYLGNWTVSLNVMIMSPIKLNDNGRTTNIFYHDQISGIVTDQLSTLLNNGVSSLNNSVSGLTVSFFKFGTRKQSIEGDFITTDQSCEMLIIPSENEE